jgi:hypothetical protein
MQQVIAVFKIQCKPIVVIISVSFSANYGPETALTWWDLAADECKAQVVSNKAGDEDEDLVDADGEDEDPAKPGNEDEVPDDLVNARLAPATRPVRIVSPVNPDPLVNLQKDWAWEDLPPFDPDCEQELPRLPAAPGENNIMRVNNRDSEPLDPALAVRPAPSATSFTDPSPSGLSGP